MCVPQTGLSSTTIRRTYEEGFFGMTFETSTWSRILNLYFTGVSVSLRSFIKV